MLYSIKISLNKLEFYAFLPNSYVVSPYSHINFQGRASSFELFQNLNEPIFIRFRKSTAFGYQKKKREKKRKPPEVDICKRMKMVIEIGGNEKEPYMAL